jgi:hypothetical protein
MERECLENLKGAQEGQEVTWRENVWRTLRALRRDRK